MLHQTLLYSGLVSPFFYGCQKRKKRKKIPQYAQVMTTELCEQGGSLSSLLPLPCNLDQTSRGKKNDTLSALRWQWRAFNTTAKSLSHRTTSKNIQGTKGLKKTLPYPRTAKCSKALTTAKEKQNNFGCCQRFDESLFFGLAVM